MSRSSGLPLLIVFVTVFIDLLGFGIVMPLLARYGEYYQASGWTLAVLMASFSAMQFLFAPVWGGLSDRIGRRPVLMLGLAGSAVSYTLFGIVSSQPHDATLLGLGMLGWLFVSRIGAGIFGATIPTAQAYIADTTTEATRGRGMALIGAAFGIGFTFGPLIGAMFVTSDPAAPPSAGPGFVAAALSAVAFLLAAFRLPESLQPENVRSHAHGWRQMGGIGRAFGRPALAVILASLFLSTFAFAQFETTLALLTRHLGMADRYNFYVFAYVGFVLALSQGFLVRRLLPRLGEYVMSIAGIVLMSAGLGLVGLACEQESRTLLLWVLPVAVIGFSALTPSLHSLLSLRSAAHEQGEILGVGQSMSAISRILGPLLGIWLFHAGESAGRAPVLPYWSGAAMAAVCLLLVVNLRRGSAAPATESETQTAAAEH